MFTIKLKKYQLFDKEKLKLTIAKYFNQIIEPVRKYFFINEMKKLHERVLLYKPLPIHQIPTQSPFSLLKLKAHNLLFK